MGRQPSVSSRSGSEISEHDFYDVELECPFGYLDNLEESDLPGIAYEIFFMSCRSSPGFSAKSGNAHQSPLSGAVSSEDGGNGNAGGRLSLVPSGTVKGGTGLMVVNSKLKKALGLKTRRPTSMRGMASHLAGSGVPNSPGRMKRPMTSAEIMRLQMRVTEHSDGRLRKTIMRTFVGQLEKRAETVILPLELLRQLKLSEFSDTQEYHQWQIRQLKVLEAGLLLYPSIAVDKQNPAALRLKEIVRASEIKAIDTSKNSEAMRSLCESVVALAWRNPNGAGPGESCHWADGYPMNFHLYVALLESIFDHRDETVVLDEVDELVELMKKTWTTLGINRMIHNLCFAWVMFKRYIETGQIEPDLLTATLAMLVEVSNDAKKADLEPNYTKALSSAMVLMQCWAEKRMLDYHDNFHDMGSASHLENILSLALSTTKIISEDLSSTGMVSSSANRVDYYIKSSMRHAFSKILESGAAARSECIIAEVEEDPSKILVQMAKETEQLAINEKETFSPVLRKWHPVPTAVAAMTVHNCFGIVLQQYLGKVTALTNELVRVLQAAAKLENVLVQMVLEDAADFDDGGKAIAREMVPYEVDKVVLALLKTWIEERLKIGNECVIRAKETESWMPKSKSEPFAQSAMDLLKLAKVTVDEFFEIPLGSRDGMVEVLADGLEVIFQEYIVFVSQCGTKQNYVPNLPPLTRCNQDSRFVRLWKKATMRLHAGSAHSNVNCCVVAASDHPRPSTSRGTQRLYIRLNTLHYILAHLHALDKSLSLFSHSNSSKQLSNSSHRLGSKYYFEASRAAVQSAIEHVSEVAAYRLIFLDSHHSFYDGLYMGDVSEKRIRPALRVLKQNLTLLQSILTDRAQPLAAGEVMRASFEAFLMVLLAGGSERAFQRSNYEMVMEDFRSLKKVFCASGEGLVAEDVVDREAELVEGIVGLMGLPTERLVEDFCIAACEASGLGGLGAAGQKVPMPPTTGRWHQADPNTILRVLCHRDEEAANHFLKKMFQLAKRR